MVRAKTVIFRIFYSTSFTVVFLLLAAFVVSTPADTLYQSYKAGRITDIIIVAGAYVLTGLLAALVYASRLYTNRSTLRDIPKTFLPIEKEDLPAKSVRRLIVDALQRSAVVAYQARPRGNIDETDSREIRTRITTITGEEAKRQGEEPTWGEVAHPGWSSPRSPDLPDLQYETVIKELPDLVEAKAVSLTPIDPRATAGLDGMPMPDEAVIEILQRPAEMGMRQYFGQLIALGVVRHSVLSREFLALYEKARFGNEPVQEVEFRLLMSMFAEILSSMTTLNAAEPP